MQQVTCCDARYSSAYGSRMFSIVRTVRNGTPRFEVEWLPTRCRKTFSQKRDATAWVKAHEYKCMNRTV